MSSTTPTPYNIIINNLPSATPPSATPPPAAPITRTIIVTEGTDRFEVPDAMGWEIDQTFADLTVYGADREPLATFHHWDNVAVKAATP